MKFGNFENPAGPKDKNKIAGEVEHGPEKDPFADFPRADAVVVLGNELKKDDQGRIVVGIQSKMRTLAALELLRGGVAKNIILTGGRMKFPEGGIKDVPEKSIAEAMREYIMPYLKRYNIPEENVLVEDTSINTTENVRNAVDVMKRHNIHNFYLESNQYHLGRGNQLLAEILKKEGGLNLQEVGSVTAEELLKMRSPHYKELVSYFETPSSLRKATPKAIAIGLREFLRRILIYCDPEDKIATRLANLLRK